MLIEISRREADARGLLSCTCGHRLNQHFGNDGKACGHCECKGYDEVLTALKGKIYKNEYDFFKQVLARQTHTIVSDLDVSSPTMPSYRKKAIGLEGVFEERAELTFHLDGHFEDIHIWRGPVLPKKE